MKRRILSLDGGGSWALIEAMALDALFPGLTGHAILDQFDVVIGNSGGALVLAALIADMAPRDIVALFRTPDTLGRLYVPLRGIEAMAASLGVGPKWSSAGKLAGIRAILEDMAHVPVHDLNSRPIGLRPRILIPAYSVDAQRSVVFRSKESPLGAAAGANVTLAEAVHASSAAPVAYFDAPATVDGVRYWDGGIGGLNNPVMAGVAEGAAVSGMGELCALSLGSAKLWRPVGLPGPTEPAILYAPRARLDLISSVKALATAIIDDPPDAASLHADMATGGALVRLNPSIQPVFSSGPDGDGWALPHGYTTIGEHGPLAAFAQLSALDMDATLPVDVALIADLATAWIGDRVPNQPVLMDHNTGGCTIGHPTWSAAVADWHELSR